MIFLVPHLDALIRGGDKLGASVAGDSAPVKQRKDRNTAAEEERYFVADSAEMEDKTYGAFTERRKSCGKKASMLVTYVRDGRRGAYGYAGHYAHVQRIRLRRPLEPLGLFIFTQTRFDVNGSASAAPSVRYLDVPSYQSDLSLHPEGRAA